MEIPDIVKKCVTILKGAKTDSEKFAALIVVPKMTMGYDCSFEVNKLLFESIDDKFLRRLLHSTLVPQGCSPHAYKSVAISIMSSFCKDPRLASHPNILSNIPIFLDIVRHPEIYENEPTLISDVYQCLTSISANEEGVQTLIDQGAVVKLVDIYCSQCAYSNNSLDIILSLIQHFGPHVWNNSNEMYFHSLLNKVSLNFEKNHTEEKFKLCGVLQILITSCRQDIVISVPGNATWPASMGKGLSDILMSKIGSSQRDPALKLAAIALNTLGEEWAFNSTDKPKQFFLILVHLCGIEIRMQLEDRSFQDCVKNSDLVMSCFIVIEMAVTYIINNPSHFEVNETESMNKIITDAFTAVLETLKKVTKLVSVNSKDEKVFLYALVRACAAWLAQETIALKDSVYELLPYMFSVANETFYSYKTYYATGSKGLQLNTPLNKSDVDILRIFLPALCSLTSDDKGRRIFLDTCEDEVLYQYLIFHWSIICNSESTPEKSDDSRTAFATICNVFMNVVILEPQSIENRNVYMILLQFILNNLPRLEVDSNDLILLGNLCVLGLLLININSKKLDKLDVTVKESLSIIIKFLWNAYDVDATNGTLIVSNTYERYWFDLVELWSLGMQAILDTLDELLWFSELVIETGWVQIVIGNLAKLKIGGIPPKCKAAYEELFCQLVEKNGNATKLFEELEINILRNHTFEQLCKQLNSLSN